MKAVFAALVLATTSYGAFASEASPSVEPHSTLSRAEVRSDITSPAGIVTYIGDATVFAEPRSSGSRTDVRAQALAQTGHGTIVSYGEATVFGSM